MRVAINLTLGFHQLTMSSALFIPTACLTCDRTWLASTPSELNGVCPSCHGRAEVVPGECYREEDCLLFEKVERAVFRAQLTEQTSYRVWATLSNVPERARRPKQLLNALVDTVPSLVFLIDELAADRTQLSKALGMTLTTVTVHLRTLEARRHGSSLALGEALAGTT